MKVILINGLIASGKTTIGRALAEMYQTSGKSVVFFDLDDEVHRLQGSEIFASPEEKLHIWLAARKNIAQYVREKGASYAIVAGPFYEKAEIVGFTDYSAHLPYLFNLDVPFAERIDRSKRRVPHSNLLKVERQQKKFTKLPIVYGLTINNTRAIHETVEAIMQKVENGVGILEGI